MVDNQNESVDYDEVESQFFSDFLENTPPGIFSHIRNLFTTKTGSSILTRPEIQLHCDSEVCQGVRIFQRINEEDEPIYISLSAHIIHYRCRNCGKTIKTFALMLRHMTDNPFNGDAYKLGEFPSYGPPIPSRVIKLVGPDRDNFIKGRRAEIQGLGIGAYAYYRRVVEKQTGRLIKEISKVARRTGTSEEILKKFEEAANETQYKKAIGMISSSIPSTLFIDGHNPLTLLHSALSQGIHDATDEECLEAARSIRVVLTELSERISIALKDHAEIEKAIARLTKPITSGSQEDKEEASRGE